MGTMTRRTLLAIAALAVTASPAMATQPERVADSVTFTAPLAYYTNRCGVPVRFTLSGRIDSDLFYDQSGTIVREVDTQPGATQTFSSPYHSFSFPFASVLHTTYSNGASVGSDAVSTGEGLAGKIPGIPADAGSITYQAQVEGTSPAGIPIVGFEGILAMRGHGNDADQADNAICDALKQ